MIIKAITAYNAHKIWIPASAGMTNEGIDATKKKLLTYIVRSTQQCQTVQRSAWIGAKARNDEILLDPLNNAARDTKFYKIFANILKPSSISFL